jgi:hypothetical protein
MNWTKYLSIKYDTETNKAKIELVHHMKEQLAKAELESWLNAR